MGNSTSSSGRGHHEETVDFGYLVPQGVYSGPRDWNQPIVSQLICARRLAPFYRPLEEYNESWDDDQILAARKESPEPEGSPTESITRIESISSGGSKTGHNKRSGSPKEPSKPDAAVYRGAVECPICFLYYPPNINHSRCCDQAICTECFVQIKRSEPTTTHLVSEPAACPYCVQENFGVVYSPPPWRAGIGSEGTPFTWPESPKGNMQLPELSTRYPAHKRRQKSFGADSPEVVTTDQIRPDWEAKLASVRAAVTRRANRRIIMRQVGDRLIPVGVTSGRVHPLSPDEIQAETAEGGGSRRSRRRQQQSQEQGFDQFLGSMGLGGHDLEELMVMEAMRLSLLDQEQQQRKEAEEKKKKLATETAEDSTISNNHLAPGPGPSTLEARSINQTSTSTNGSSSPASSSPISLSPFPPPRTAHQPESLSAQRRSWTFSRSRTPSPSPSANPGSSQSINDTATWQHRTLNPSPLNTPSPPTSGTASTASTVRGSTESAADSVSNLNGDPPIPAENRSVVSASTLPITVEASALRQHADDASAREVSLERPDKSERPSAISRDSTASSIISTETSAQTGLAYQYLPSSPDSIFANVPLLSPEAESRESLTLRKVLPGEEPNDNLSETGRQG